MTASFCALCTRPIVGEPREFDGCRICVECDDGEIVAYDSDRGYSPSEGIGYAFGQQLTKAYQQVVPARVRQLDEETSRSPIPNEDWATKYDPRDRLDGLSKNQRQYLGESSRNRGQRGKR